VLRRLLLIASGLAIVAGCSPDHARPEGGRPASWLSALDRLAAGTGDAGAPGEPEAEEAFAVREGSFDCEVDGVLGTCMPVWECRGREGHAATRGHCPGPLHVQCCTAFGSSLCDPGEVRQPNEGNTAEAPGEGGCPRGMARVAGFCVDRYEASLVRGDGRPWSPYLNPGHVPVRAVSVQWAVPQGYVSGEQAAEACLNAGKRLCRDEEWLRACQGPEGTTFPYGDTRLPGVCNDHRGVHPAIEYFGAQDSAVFSRIGNPCLNQLPESLDPTGARAECVTAEGVFDMMGNLHEWTADPAGTFRGGYYMDTEKNGPGCRYATTAHDSSHWDYSTGFRCCADL
jgi:hypothetical protein